MTCQHCAVYSRITVEATQELIGLHRNFVEIERLYKLAVLSCTAGELIGDTRSVKKSRENAKRFRSCADEIEREILALTISSEARLIAVDCESDCDKAKPRDFGSVFGPLRASALQVVKMT